MKIVFKKTRLEVQYSEKSIDLIDVCYDHDTPVNFGCRIGQCGTCKVVISKGLANVSAKNENEEDLTSKPNERLACQCSIRGDVEIE